MLYENNLYIMLILAVQINNNLKCMKTGINITKHNFFFALLMLIVLDLP